MGTVEQAPTQEGRNMTMVLSPLRRHERREDRSRREPDEGEAGGEPGAEATDQEAPPES